MSSKTEISETTPNAKQSCEAIIQSEAESLSKQDLAQTLNPNNCNASVGNSSAVNEDMDVLMSEQTAEVPKTHQKSDTNANQKTGHKEEVKRRRTRRSRKRKWQRLEWKHKRLQWSESTEQEVKRLHMKVVEHGQPLAPYNTTQFIMNEHNCDKEIDFEAIHGRVQRMRRTEDQSGGTNDDDFYSSPEDESDYLQQQFHEAYDNIHAERLSAMNKNELVQEYLQLEDRVEELEKRLKESNAQPIGGLLRTTNNSEVQTEQCSSDATEEGVDGTRMDDNDDSGAEADEHLAQRADDLKKKIKSLSEENSRLRCDNQRLQRILEERQMTSNSVDTQDSVGADQLAAE